MRRQVVIVGAGPSGLLLGKLLHQQGIDVVILERASAEYVLGRIRAGVIEQSTIDLLDEAGVGERMNKEGIVIRGVLMCVQGKRHRIDVEALAGQSLMVYGQTEITRDLMNGCARAEVDIIYEASDVSLQDFDTEHPRVRYRRGGRDHEIVCDIIAGCDGYHGVSRKSVPARSIKEYERVYPFGWMGLLADTPPVVDEPMYIRHEAGFAMCSFRSWTRSRYYVQCPLDDRIENWSDERFWTEFRSRLDPESQERLTTGPSIEKSIAPLRSFVAEPMRFGRLFLAGDASHVVPPTGAKGLNLAVSDVRYLSQAIAEYYLDRSSAGLDHYSARALARVWKAERFSWATTMLTHNFPDAEFESRMAEAEMDYLLGSRHASSAFAENFVGLAV